MQYQSQRIETLDGKKNKGVKNFRRPKAIVF